MAKTTKKDKEVSLSDVLWNCRNALRGVGSTEKNRDAVMHTPHKAVISKY